MSDRLLTLMQLAQTWGWSRGRLWRLVKTSDSPVVRIGRKHYFREAAVEAWIAARERKPAVTPAPVRKSVEAEAKDWGLELDELLH